MTTKETIQDLVQKRIKGPFHSLIDLNLLSPVLQEVNSKMAKKREKVIRGTEWSKLKNHKSPKHLREKKIILKRKVKMTKCLTKREVNSEHVNNE